MGDNSKIAWTDATLNFAYGCQKVSPACANCYAVGMVRRLVNCGHVDLCGLTVPPTMPAQDWSGGVVVKPERIEQALHWKKPRRIFINSLSDTFHDAIPENVLGHLWAVMRETPQHTYQILTKRPERMLSYIGRGRDRIQWPQWPLPNVWLGVTVENQAMADKRIPLLLNTPAAVRFVSMEPLLGPVDMDDYVWERDSRDWGQDRPGLDWVIVGGESGPNARPMHPEWVRTIRDQCQEAGVPFFFKQWGEWRPAHADECFSGNMTTVWNQKDHPWLNEARQIPQPKTTCVHWGAHVYRSMIEHPETYGWQVPVLRVGKKAAGDLLDGVQFHQMPDGVTR